MEASAAAWFSIMEAQFALAKINQENTKFFHALAALPAEVVTTLSQSILNDQRYDNLKAAVINAFEQTKPEIFDKLISTTVMMGKPSQFLNEIQKAASKVGVGEELVRHKFLQALPHTISPIIATQKGTPLKDLGQLADELMPFVHQANYALSQNMPPTYPSQCLLNKNKYSPSASNYDNKLNIIPTGVRPYNRNQRPKICRAHLYFASEAKTCKPWCKWPHKNPELKILPNSRSASPTKSEN